MFNYCKKDKPNGAYSIAKLSFLGIKHEILRRNLHRMARKKLKMRHKRNKETQTSVCLCLLISVATTGIEPVFHA